MHTDQLKDCAGTNKKGDKMSNLGKRTEALIKQRVNAGCALLDKKLGPEWPSKINLETLDIGNGAVCVIAQATKQEYAAGCRTVGLDPYSYRAVSVGMMPSRTFIYNNTPEHAGWRKETEALKIAWVSCIRRLKKTRCAEPETTAA